MTALTLKQIKEARCKSLNTTSFEKAKQLKELLGDYKVIACSVGKYGINGKFIYSKTLDNYYKITGRCIALFVIE